MILPPRNRLLLKLLRIPVGSEWSKGGWVFERVLDRYDPVSGRQVSWKCIKRGDLK